MIEPSVAGELGGRDGGEEEETEVLCLCSGRRVCWKLESQYWSIKRFGPELLGPCMCTTPSNI